MVSIVCKASQGHQISRTSDFDFIVLQAQHVHLPCPTKTNDSANDANAKTLSLTVHITLDCHNNCHCSERRLTTVADNDNIMSYHHHDFEFRRERSRERIHINLGQHSSCDTCEADDSSSDRDSIKHQPDFVRGRATKREPFFLEQPRLAQQNIIQQNLNLVSGVQRVRRRGSRPDFPILSVNYFDQWMEQCDRCVHGYDPASACLLCGPNQRDRARSRHDHDGDDLYNVDKAIRESREAHEDQQKKHKKAREAQDKETAEMQAEWHQLLCSRAGQEHTLPNLLFRQNDILEQRKNEIRREIERCDADMKRLHEGAAREAQFRGHEHRKTVLEKEQAGRFEELRYGWATRETADKTKKQPRSILINKRVRFLGRME